MVTLELRFTWAFGKSLGEPERGGFMKEFEHVVADSMGIHARPAGMLAKEAKKYGSKVFIRKDEKIFRRKFVIWKNADLRCFGIAGAHSAWQFMGIMGAKGVLTS